MDSKEAILLSKIIFTIILLLGFFTVIDLTNYQSDHQSLLNKENVRSPASLTKISDILSNTVISKSVLSTLDLNCLRSKKPANLISQSAQLRLIGKFCNLKAQDEIEKIYITNTRNGFQATLFELDQNSFSTDYVFLEEGKNSIVISKVESDQVTQTPITELTIERQKRFTLDRDPAQDP